MLTYAKPPRAAADPRKRSDTIMDMRTPDVNTRNAVVSIFSHMKKYTYHASRVYSKMHVPRTGAMYPPFGTALVGT